MHRGHRLPGAASVQRHHQHLRLPQRIHRQWLGGCALNPPSDLAVSPATYSPSSALTVTWYFSTGVTYQVRYRRTDSWVPDLITDAYYVVPPTIYQPGEEVEFCVRAVDGANVSEAACLPLEFAPLCEADFRVAQNTCSPCPNETHNLAGDDPYGGDTACDDTPFSEWRKAGRQTNGTFLARAGNSHFAGASPWANTRGFSVQRQRLLPASVILPALKTTTEASRTW